ncbi:sensor histidine kinase [Scytonema sp. NUACC26]|uniref:sensor histidine kinase n=1 Tax=Scytonema sp. NUACC26 TaxID=3140176 RepID=UPI0038B28905
MSKIFFNWQICQSGIIFERLKPTPELADYKMWRNEFLWRRLRVCLWVGFAIVFSSLILNTYQIFYLNQEDIFPKGSKYLILIEDLSQVLLFVTFFIVHKTQWGRRYPFMLWLFVSWACTLFPQILATLNGFARLDLAIWGLVFLAQATLLPVCWQMHLISQLTVFIYYLGVNSVLGLKVGTGYSLFNEGLTIYTFWLCFICNFGVYLYERLQRAEFESRRELRVFLHAISHDLRTPLMGTAIVLQNLLKKSESSVNVDSKVLQRLLEGNSRQINLINSLQEAYSLEVRGVQLHCQPVQLSTVVASVLHDLESLLQQNRVTVNNFVQVDLPFVNADAIKLGRVFSNLISNALKHNPHEITLTIDASVKGKKILCCVQDNGVGMSKQQCNRLFELYARGENARFMPGLGIGLYVCRQIITAHGGKIGVKSKLGVGSTFWFTLPIFNSVSA